MKVFMRLVLCAAVLAGGVVGSGWAGGGSVVTRVPSDLFIAVQQGSRDDVAACINQLGQACVNMQDSSGNTPLHYAAQRVDSVAYEIVQLLLSNGAHAMSANSDGVWPIQLAHDATIQALLAQAAENEKIYSPGVY